MRLALSRFLGRRREVEWRKRRRERLSLLQQLESRTMLDGAPSVSSLVNTLVPRLQTSEYQSTALEVTREGDTLVVFSGRGLQDNDGVFFRRLPAGGAVAAPDQRANLTIREAQQRPSIATYVDGRYVIAWDGRGPGDQQGIFARWYAADDSPLTGEVRINEITPGDQREADVAVAADGTTYFVWSGTAGAEDPDGIFRRTFDASGNALSAQSRVNVTTAGRQNRPGVAAADGRSVITWSHRGGAGLAGGVFYRVYPPDSASPDEHSAAEHAASASTAASELHSRVGIDDQGRFVIAWAGYTPGDDLWNIYTRRFAADGSPRDDHDRLVNTQVGGVQRDPDLAMAPDGRYVISWTSGVTDGSGWEVYAKVFPAGDGAGAEADFLVNDTSGSNSGHQVFSAVAIGSGPAHIAWSGTGGIDRRGVWIRHTSLAERPTLHPLPPQMLDEQTELRLPLAADPGRSNQVVRFDLEPGRHPLGMVIDPRTGVLLWTPTERDGPGEFSATVVARDADHPELADRQTVRITVREVNRAPRLDAIPDAAIDEGQVFRHTVSASDPDWPANQLSYALVEPPSASLRIDAVTGELTWASSEADGPAVYPITVRVTDSGSPRLSSLVTLTLTVREANDPPQISPVADLQIPEQQRFALPIFAQDADGGRLRYSVDDTSLGRGMEIDDGGVLRWTPSELQGPGRYPVRITVTDTARASSTVEFVISVLEVNRPPRLAPLPNSRIELGHTVAVDAAATDPDRPSNGLRYRLDAASRSRGATIDERSGRVRWTPDAPGIYPVTVTVRDDGTPPLSDSNSFTVAVGVPFAPPVFEPVESQIIDEQTELRVPLTAVPATTGRRVRYALGSGTPAGLTIDQLTGLVRWIPGEGQGPAEYHVTLEAYDADAPQVRSRIQVPITVREVNRPPIIGVPSDQRLDEGGVLDVAVTASDPDLPSNDLRYQFTTGIPVPPTATIDPISGRIRWATDESVGPAMVMFSVTVVDTGNPSLSDTGTFDVTVRERNEPPVITPIADLEIDEQVPFHFSIPASDPDLPTDTLTYRLDTASRVAGMTIDHAGQLSWTPSEVDGPRAYPVTVTVSDDAARPLTTSRSFQIRVREVNRRPILDPVGSFSVRRGTTVRFTAAASDPDVPVNRLRYAVRGNLPVGYAFDAATGRFEWTPDEAAESRVYDFTLRATDDGSPALFNEQPVSIEVLPDRIELVEEDRFVTGYEQAVLLEAGTAALQFRFDSLQFDRTDPDSINDAFEAALVDAVGRPVAAVIAPQHDAFFNQTEGEAILLGAGTLLSRDGTSVTLTVDVSHLPAGSRVRLIQRLVNNDQDDLSRVTVLPGVEQLATSPTGESSLITGHAFPPLPLPLVAKHALASDSDALWRHLTDVTASIRPEYSHTAFDVDTEVVAAGLKLSHNGSYPVRGPLLVAVLGVDLPQVRLVDFAGVLPLDTSQLPKTLAAQFAGVPYYDASSLLEGDALLPGQQIELQLRFRNPTLQRFDYRVHVLGAMNRAPEFTSVAPSTVRLGRQYAYPAAASDPDRDRLSYALLSGPEGLSIDPDSGLVSWTPGAADVGQHRVVMRALDPYGGEDLQPFTIDVRSAGALNRPPMFTSTPVLDAYVGRPYLYASRAADPDFDPLRYRVLQGPEGIQIVAGPSPSEADADMPAGAVRWIPTAASVGSRIPVMLQVEDGHGGVATQNYRIFVHPNPANLPPVIVTAPETSLRLPDWDHANPIGAVAPESIQRLLARGDTYAAEVSVTLPADANRQTADIVLVVDESGSMREQAWIADVIARLDASLVAEGIEDSRYAIVGYGSSPAPRVITEETQYELTIYGPSGGIVNTFPVHPGDTLSPVVFPSDGTYRVAVSQPRRGRVRGGPDGGSSDRSRLLLPQAYHFTPTVEPPAGGVRRGWGMHAGMLVDGARQHRFTAAAGDLVLVDGIQGSLVGLEIRDAEGGEVLARRDLLDDPDPLVLPHSGDYQLRLSGPASAAYQFRLLDPIADATPLATAALTATKATTGTLDDPDQIDLYRFDASAGLPFFLDALRASGDGSRPGESFQVRLLGPDGLFLRGDADPVLSSGDPHASLSHDIGPLVIPADGSYTLMISRAAGQQTEEPISYAFLPREMTGSQEALGDGETVTHSLPEPTGSRAYDLPLEAGDTLSLAFLSHLGGATTWQLLDPDGLRLAQGRGSPDGSAEDPPGELPIRESGRYRFLIQGHAENSTAVDYTLRVSVGAAVLPPLDGLPVVWEAPMAGAFSSGETIRYGMDLQQGEAFFASLVTPDPLSARLRVYAPSGALLFDTGPTDTLPSQLEPPPDPEPPRPLVALRSGRYVIDITRTGRASEYVFQVASATSPLTLDQPVQGVVDPGGGRDAFVVTVAAGQSLRIDAAAPSAAFADAEAAASRARYLEASGSEEDGYWGIQYALDQLEFRDGADRQIILLTDEDRDPLQSELSFAALQARLVAEQVDLHTITQVHFLDPENSRHDRALGFVPTADDGTNVFELFYADGQGNTESLLRQEIATVGGHGTTEQDYVSLSSGIGGSHWDISILRDGGEHADLTRQSFTRAFVSSLTDRIGREYRVDLVPSQVAAPVAIGEPVFDGRVATFPVIFSGDGDAWDFELQFVDPQDAATLYGSVPVGLAAGYRYQVRAIDPEGDSVQYALVEGQGGTFDPATGTLLWAPAVPGEYRFAVSASDPFGGVDTQTWTVAVETAAFDNRPPLLEPVESFQQEVQRAFALGLSARDSDGDALTYQLLPGASSGSLAPLGMSLDATTGQLRWRPTTSQEGTHEITVRAVDGRGGVSVASFTIEVVPPQPARNARPIVTSAAPSSAIVGERYRYETTAHDPDGDTLAYELSFAPEGMVIDPLGVVSWLPTDVQVGTHDAIVRIADPFGGVALQAFRLHVSVANDPPIFLSVPQTATAVGREWTYQLRAEDPNADDQLRFELTASSQGDPVPEGMLIDSATGRVSWIPEAVGRFRFAVRVVDQDAAFDVQTIELQVFDPSHNTAPQIMGAPRRRLAFDRSYVWQIPATDPDGDALAFELVAGPGGLTVDRQGLLQWTPAASQVTTATPHQVAVRVEDARGEATRATWSIAVGHTAANQAPKISGSPPSVVVAGRFYLAPFTATDPDGDTVLWSLAEAPAGMQIDSQGLVHWRPAVSDVGRHRIVVSAADTAGGRDSDAFTLEVRGSNHPAAIQGDPPVLHRRGTAYETTFAATDLDGDSVRFRFADGSDSHGAFLEAASGRLQWNPTADGLYRFHVLALDDFGEGSGMLFDVTVSAAGPNTPPRFHDTLPGIAAVDSLYSRQFSAADPDGDPLTYAVAVGPAGLSITADGTVTWTPPASALETTADVQLTATDSGGLTASYRFGLPVSAANRPPKFTSDPPASPVTAGQAFRHDLVAEDPDGDRLSFVLASGPAGLTLNSATGRVTWNTDASDIGDHAIRVVVSDGRWGMEAGQNAPPAEVPVTQQWTIRVSADVRGPQVTLAADRTLVDVGTEVRFEASAHDDVAVTKRTLNAGDAAIALDAAGRGRHRFASPGRYTVTATASDAAGNTAEHALEILVRDPATAAPRPRILAPGDQQRITAPLDVAISVDDADADVTSVRLLVAPLDGSAPFRQIAARTAARGETLTDLQDRVIGRFDPTLLASGPYKLRLVAEDAAFNTSTVDQVIQVEGRLKLGNFQLTVTDLTIPVGGIPITIVRHYDTLDADRGGDFGHGWSLEVQQANVSVEQRTLGGLGSGRHRAFVDGTRVLVHTPEGTEEGFTFRAVPDQVLFGAVISWKTNFDPDPGNAYLLTATAGGLKKLGSEFLSSFGTTYHPADPEFGNRFELEAIADQRVYGIDASTGRTVSVRDRHGNQLSFTPDGIISNRGRSVTFARDMRGRIAQITDPRGNELRYSYDAAGDLVAFTDRMGNTTRYAYYDSPAHYLDTVADPLGNISLQAAYRSPDESAASGAVPSTARLASLTDGSGDSLGFHYDIERLSETLSDAQGVRSTLRYDAHGNPVEETARGGYHVVRSYRDPALGVADTETRIIGAPDGDSAGSDDQTVSRTFDSRGQLTSETDARGNVTRYQYTREGIPLAIVDPLGRTTSFAYDGRDLVAIRPAVGDPTYLSYDQWGQVVEVRSGGSDGRRDPAADALGSASGGMNGGSVGQTIRLGYNGFGDLITQTDADQVTRSVRYDENGNQTGTAFVWTDPFDPGRTETVATVVERAANDLPQATTSPAGTHQIQFDPLNRPAVSVDSSGLHTEKIYDVRGLAIETRTQSHDSAGAPVWLISRTVYDELGRAIYNTHSAPEGTPPAAIEGTHTVYDSDGRATMTERLQGLEIAITDRGTSRPAATLVSAGRVLSSSQPFYDAAGRVWRSVDDAGRETQTLYDSFGQAIESRTQAVTEQGAVVWLVSRTAFDSLGRSTFKTDRFLMPADTPLGQGSSGPVFTTHTIYDSLGRAAGTERVAGAEVAIVNGETVATRQGQRISATSTVYDDAGRTSRSISAAGEITDYLHDDRGRQIGSIGHPVPAASVGLGQRFPGRWVRQRSELEFNAYGQTAVQRSGVVQVEEADGTLVTIDYQDSRETQFAYDQLGRLIRTRFPDGTSTSTEYDAQGRVAAEIDQLGLARRFAYNSQGQLTSVTLPESTDPTSGLRVAGSYEYGYDAQGNQTLIRDPLGRETRFSYNSSGLQIARTLPLGHGADGTAGTVDDGGVAAGEWSERFEYDHRGRRVVHVSFEGVVTQTIYDDAVPAEGALPSGRAIQKRFFDSWDAFAARPETPDEVWNFTFDAFGREIRVDQIDHRSGVAVMRTSAKRFDSLGQLVQHTTPEGTLSYSYDELGRKTATRIGDSAGPVRSIEYAYDRSGRLETVTERSHDSQPSAAAVHRYFYDLYGNLDAELAANGLFKDYLYSPMNRLESLVHYRTDGSAADLTDLADNATVVRFDYKLREDGRHASLVETWWRDPDGDGQAEPFTATFSYGYDELGRLTDEVFNHWDDQLDYHDTYLMDSVGNRLERHRDRDGDAADRITTYAYDANDRLIEETIRDASGRIESQLRYAYDHTQTTGKISRDGAGEIQLAHHYSYDLQGRLETATVTNHSAGQASSESRSTYRYDRSGIRVSSLVETDATADGILESRMRTGYMVDHENFTGYQQVLREVHVDADSGASAKTVDYTYGLDELTQATREHSSGGGNFGSESLTFLHDAHGSVRAVLAAEAAIAHSADNEQIYFYDAYGNKQNTVSPSTSLLYSGELFDARTQQQYLRARYYEPASGRFSRLDPYAGNLQEPFSLHRYGYTHGDPIQGVDPTGMFTASTTLSAGTLSSGSDLLSFTAAASITARLSLRLAWKLAVPTIVYELEKLNQTVVPLPRLQVLADYEYALLAQAGYEDADLAGVRNRGWRELDRLSDFGSGFHAVLFEGNGERVLSYAGTLSASDWMNNFQQGLLGDAPQYRQAIDLVTRLETQFGHIDRLVGHSLGGGLASAAAIVHNRAATTFNAAGVNRRFVERFGSGLEGADRLVDAYRVRGEILSTLQDADFLWITSLSAAVSGIGLVGALGPDSVGRDFWLPPSSGSHILRHFMSDVLAGMRKMI